MAWCGCSRKGRQSLASSGGGAAGWSVSTSTPYILWRRRSSKALRPFSGDMYGWVFCAKNWQLLIDFIEQCGDKLYGHHTALLSSQGCHASQRGRVVGRLQAQKLNISINRSMNIE